MYPTTVISPILVDSPVEFILIGPVNDQLKVLVKSKNAGIDLIGFSQDENEKYYTNVSSLFVNSLIPQKIYSENAPQLYGSVNTNIETFQNYRQSIYKFVWRGVTNYRYNNAIKSSFKSKLPDIAESIRNQDLESLEWSLAVIISLCNSSITNKQKVRNQTLIIGVVYLLTILIAIFWFVSRNPKFLF